MPLNKAKPGTAGFKKNIKTEIAAGKPQKQAVAIAYSASKDAKGQMHVYLPGRQMGRLLGANVAGTIRTVARGDRTISLMRKGTAKDMQGGKFQQLRSLLNEFLREEEQEQEHKGTDSACSCQH